MGPLSPVQGGLIHFRATSPRRFEAYRRIHHHAPFAVPGRDQQVGCVVQAAGLCGCGPEWAPVNARLGQKNLRSRSQWRVGLQAGIQVPLLQKRQQLNRPPTDQSGLGRRGNPLVHIVVLSQGQAHLSQIVHAHRVVGAAVGEAHRRQHYGR